MKKLIKYPDEIHKALQHLAIDANMDLTAYIAKVLTDHVKGKKGK
jgi:predicted HicB family RNase H-like nuclease